MELKGLTLKKLMIAVFALVVFYAALQNLPFVASLIRRVIGMFSPFLLGGAMAFVLNVPMRAVERHLFGNSNRMKKAQRPAALVLTLLLVSGVLALACLVIAPEIRTAAMSIAEQVPTAIDRLREQTVKLEAYLPQVEAFVESVSIDWNGLTQKAVQLIQNWGSNLISSGGGFVSNVVSGVVTFVIGLIFSFYVLLQKEKLGRQGRQVAYALLPEKKADRVLDILRLSNKIFSGFLSGQCLEAVILGTLFVIAMTVFRMPYALLVGVLIALTALIPIVGAFIGCGIGAILIAISDPWKAMLFIVMFLVIQQIEGNLIYPHVVGSSVGLPSIWVLVAVTLGSSLMGVVGMLLFIPLCSVLYALFRGYVKDQLREKNIPSSKWKNPPK